MINLIILGLILLMLGFFAGIEIAFVSANKMGVGLKKKQGNQKYLILSRLLESPYRFIGSCLVGYTLFLTIYGLQVSQFFEPFWKLVGMQKMEGSAPIKVIFELLLAVVLVLFVEFTFKAIFRAKNDAALSIFVLPMKFFHSIFSPVSQFFVAIAVWILKYLFNTNIDAGRRPFSRVDIEHFYQQTKESQDESQELNRVMFEKALGLPGIKVRSCLVPRTEIVAVPIDATIAEVRNKMVATKLSKMVVYEGNIDNIVGYIHQINMFSHPSSIKDALLPIPTVPATMSVTDLIGLFSKQRKTIAWVVDEFGGTAGVVTMEDLLEEIFGEIRDEYDVERMVENQLAENEFMFSGRIEIDEIRGKYRLDLPGEVETLSGYIISNHNAIPKQGEKIIIDKYQFEILNMGETKVELVKVKLL